MQVLADGRVRRSTVEWKEIVERHRKSDLSIEAFCAKEEISRSAFATWKRRLNGAPDETSSLRRDCPTCDEAPCAAGHVGGDLFRTRRSRWRDAALEEIADAMARRAAAYLRLYRAHRYAKKFSGLTCFGATRVPRTRSALGQSICLCKQKRQLYEDPGMGSHWLYAVRKKVRTWTFSLSIERSNAGTFREKFSFHFGWHTYWSSPPSAVRRDA